ncbi:hypothetical protein EPN18_03515 [bacterium]|nr:MAG: hypothetical protein EPN18_03515 [bacterium]
MKKILPLCILVIVAVIFPVSVNAQTGSVSVALKAVNEFYTETDALTRGFEQGAITAEAQKKSAEYQDTAIKEIHAIDWIDRPGKRRFKKIHTVVETYLEKQLSLIRKLFVDITKPDAGAGETLKKLVASKDAKLKALEEASSLEVVEEKKEKPNPVIDRSPYETTPGTDKGIWER